jgi:amino acid adenylation domain-containing protein
MVLKWNDNRVEHRLECVHRLFEQQVARTPDAVAVVDGERQFSYRNLNAQANEVAHHLQGQGVAPEVMVGICIERSIEMVIALLAVLKAGGAYVPLDPSLPLQLLEFLMDDMQAPILLCSRRTMKELPPRHAATTMLTIEECRKSAAADHQNDPASPVQPENLAYMLYTSGSTGQPKGVLIAHRALANYLAWCAASYPVDEGRGSPLHSPIGFDLTVTSMFPTLLAGRTVFLLPEDATLDTLAKSLQEGDFGLVKLTPAHLSALADKIPPGAPGIKARAFVIGGEALLGEALASWRKHHPDVRLINEYGPTEATVGCCVFEAPKGADLSGPVPIGTPIQNVRLYLLDGSLQPVPAGEPGELYIAGESLARGYHRRPELTAQSFLDDPFSKSGGRLYKTGDLVRCLPDGNLEFLGRLDSQIKLRGFRIELNEIEATLANHPGVREAVVTVSGDSPNQRLTANVVARRDCTPSEEDLRGFLKQRLPEYMLPARYVLMESFPLTANGKIDRKALAVNSALPAQGAASTPRGDVEARLSAIWERVLGIPSVGLHDNFFDLGGHSLLASRMLTEIERTFGRKVSLSTLFRAATVEQMAGELREQFSAHNPRLVPIQPGGSRPPFFCVGAGPIFRALAHRLDRDQPFLGLHIENGDVTRQPYRLEDFAAVHARTILQTQPEGPYYLGGWSGSGVMAYEVAQQLRKRGHQVALLVLFDAESPVRPRFNGIDAIGARLDSCFQWFRINWALLRNSGREEFRERIRVGLTFRLAWMKGHIWSAAYRTRRSAGLQPKPVDLDHAHAYVEAGYKPLPYDGRVVLFQRSARPIGRYHDPRFGWGGVIGKLEVHEVPGDHRDMFLQPAVEILTEKLGACLLAAQESSLV